MTPAPTARQLSAVLATWMTSVRQTTRRIAGVLGGVVPLLAFLVVIGLWFVGSVFDGLMAAIEFKGPLLDGPLQLFNPLRRIAAGQQGGVDFQFFHGIAVPYLHYPLYAAFGKTIYASELSRNLVNTASLLACYVTVFAGLTRRLTPTLGLTAAALALSYSFSFNELLKPSPSLVGLRSTTPLLVFGVLLGGLRPNREAVLIGGLAGAGLLTGTEHGIATVVLIALVAVGRWWTCHPAATFGWLARVAGTYALVLAGLLLLICGPTGARNVLHYAFIDLPADQFWYFGAPPNHFLNTNDQLVDRMLWVWALGPTLLLTAGILTVCRVHPPARPTAVVTLAALIAGTFGGIGYLGYLSLHYLQTLTRIDLVVAVVAAWHVGRWLASDDARARLAVPVGRVVLGVATAIALVAGPSGWSLFRTPELSRNIAKLADAFRSDRGTLTPPIRQHRDSLIAAIDADRAARGVTRPPVIWSSYAGLLEAHYDVFHPAEDYIIHAIGETGRERYLKAFRAAAADYVVVCRADQMAYEVWLQNSTWPFYEELAMNYDVIDVTADAVLWARLPGPWRTPNPNDGRVTVTPTADMMFQAPPEIVARPDVMYVAEVEYATHNRYGGVPVVGDLARNFVFPVGCVSELPVGLPPYRDRMSFPFRQYPGKPGQFWAGTASIVGGGRVTVGRVHFRPIRADGRELAFSDPNWYRLMQKERAGQ